MKPVIRVSSVDQRIRCHASGRLSASIESKSGKDANDGNYGHWQTATVLIEQHGATAGSDYKKPDFPDDYEFPVKDSWIIDSCVRHALYCIPDNWCMIVEQELAWEYENFILVGHCDLLGISPCFTQIRMRDWKLGAVFQDPADLNWQTLLYLILAWRNYEGIRYGEQGLYQPRAFIGENIVRESTDVVATVEEFEQAEQYAVHKINESLEHYYNLTTGTKQCRWCPATMVCPGIREEMRNMIMLLTENDIKKAAEGVSDDDCAQLLNGLKILTPVFDDVKEESIKRMRAGTVLQTEDKVFSLQESTSGLKPVDDSKFFNTMVTLLGIETIEDLVDFDMASINMSTAKRVLAKARDIQESSKKKKDRPENANDLIIEAAGTNLASSPKTLINVADREEAAEE